MSKTLSKVLMICAMVVVFPLMIAGITFASYYSLDATFALDVYKNAVVEGANAKVLVNGKEYKDKAKFTDGHMKDVTLVALGDGYDFVGWFEGNLEQYAQAHELGNVKFLSTQKSLTFEMRDYENVMAIFEQTEYNLSYTYRPFPTSNEITALPEVGANKIAWGEALPVLSYAGYDYKFAGWKIKGGNDTVYTVAKFDTKKVTLEAVWVAQKQITITYTDGDTILASDSIYVGQPYTVRDIDSFEITKEDGYNYVWNNNNTTFTENTTISVEKVAVDYKVYVAENPKLISSIGTKVVFNVENVEETIGRLFNASNWSKKYMFCDFAGIKLGETVYTNAQSFANDIKASDPRGQRTDIYVTVNATNKLTTIAVSANAGGVKNLVSATAELDDIGAQDVYTLTDLGKEVNPWAIMFDEGLSTNVTVAKLAKLDDGTVLYTGTKENPIALKIVGITIGKKAMLNGSEQLRTDTVVCNADTKLVDVIQNYLEKNSTYVVENMTDGTFKDVFEIDSLTLVFDAI